jgi:type II secretory pathway component PulJ
MDRTTLERRLQAAEGLMQRMEENAGWRRPRCESGKDVFEATGGQASETRRRQGPIVTGETLVGLSLPATERAIVDLDLARKLLTRLRHIPNPTPATLGGYLFRLRALTATLSCPWLSLLCWVVAADTHLPVAPSHPPPPG